MASPLQIRNVTSTPIEIKVVERIAPPVEAPAQPKHTPLSALAHVTAKVGEFIRNDPVPSAAAIAEGVQGFDSRDVSIRVEPLGICSTDIAPATMHSRQSVRLTFEAEGERYRVDTPSPTNASTEAVPLTPNPRFRFTAVYLPNFAHLTLFSSANHASWMKEFNDDTPLSALSMPGTHNSPTHHTALPSVRCQAVSVPEQLDNGVRFLDIRVQPDDPADPSKDTLILVHGVFPVSLKGNKYLSDLVKDVFAFLARNPSESVIMSVKREGPGEHTDAQLSRRLRDHYAGDTNRWFTAPHIPTLREARGKIVLMRRFTLDDSLKAEHGGAGWCLDAEHWAYNTPHDMCPSGLVCVQDFCEVLESVNVDKKIQYAQEELNRTASCICAVPAIPAALTDPSTADPNRPTDPNPGHQEGRPPPFHLNFLSASNFWKVDCWPDRIAAKLNPAVIDYLCRRHNVPDALMAGGQRLDPGDGSTGIVILDWVGHRGDWDIVRCIVGWNVRLEMRQKGLIH